MRNTLETRIGIFVAFIAIAAILIIEILGGAGQLRGGSQMHALFQTVQELKVGDRVKMAGVEVGRVDGINIVSNAVQVSMRMKKNAQIKTDSQATVQFAGLLGQNFVALSFGSPEAPLAEPDTYLDTAEQPDLSAIMLKLDNVATGVENLTRSFSGESIENLLGPLTDFLTQNREPLRVTIANISKITGTISDGEGTVGQMIFDDSLHDSALASFTDLQRVVSDIQVTITQAQGILSDVNAGQGTAGKLIRDDTLYNDTTASMSNLREILEKINQGEGSVGLLVNEEEFYDNAKLMLQKVERSVESLEDTGPLSVLGIAIGSLF